VEQMSLDAPFYLVVFGPSSPARFANVVAVRARGDPIPQAPGEVELLDATGGSATQTQHWAEYDLSGSPASAELAAAALLGHDAEGAGEADRAPSSTSYAVLHGVWRSETRGGGKCVARLPPAPQPSAQWMLELLSMPLSREPDASKPLQALRMEIGRLETWCQCWMAGERWAAAADDAGGPAAFRAHPWQSSSHDPRRRGSDDEPKTPDESSMAVDACTASPGPGALQRHREDFGAKIDAFIDASIHDTRGSTLLGRQGRARDVHALDGFPAREGLDFTERLWNLAHYAHDDGDLSEAVAAAAEGLETRKLQPFIHHSNKSPMAQVIRQTLQMAQATTLVDEEAERERLAGQLDLWINEQPLDPFVHCGLHKLRADFWFYFVGGHLAPPRQ
ncbi:hypothetical protein IWQ56_006756, partial [Coemansia nantahalensis]